MDTLLLLAVVLFCCAIGYVIGWGHRLQDEADALSARSIPPRDVP